MTIASWASYGLAIDGQGTEKVLGGIWGSTLALDLACSSRRIHQL